MFVSKKPPTGPIRGMVAQPGVPLQPLKNVGKMRVSGEYMMLAPFVKQGLEMLKMDPLDDGAVGRNLCDAPDSVRYRDHLLYLWKDVGAYDVAPSRKEVMQWTDPPKDIDPWIGSSSAVHKDADFARAINNLKFTNAACNGPKVAFRLLGAKKIVELLLSVPFKNGFRILHGDFTNMYYQVPIGKRLALRCCLKLGDVVLMPNVMSMGHTHSCGTCTSIVWGAILFHFEHESRLGVPADVEFLVEAPSHIELEDGGFIILIYDSILIVTKEDNAKEWEKRLKRNCEQHLNMEFKYLRLEGLKARVNYGGMVLRSDRAGLTWSLDTDAVEVWKTIARSELVPSPRTLFKLISYLRFAAPILGWREGKLGRLTKVQSELGVIEDWDEPKIGEAIMKAARRMILEIDTPVEHPKQEFNEWKMLSIRGMQHRKSHVEKKRGREEVVFVAVDATEYRWAMTPMQNGKEQEELCRYGMFEQKTAIDVAEAYVLRKGLEYGRTTTATVCVVANDNQGVGRGFVSGFSRSEGVDKEIDKARVAGEPCLVVVDVSTEDNFADIGTRPDEPEKNTPEQYKHRRKETWARLETGYSEWKRSRRAYNVRPKLSTSEQGQADPHEDSAPEPDLEMEPPDTDSDL